MEKASSFHGRTMMWAAEEAAEGKQLQRPRTVPNLVLAHGGLGKMAPHGVKDEQRPRLTKLLLNATISGSVGAEQVVMRPEETVEDLISAAVRGYVKKGRRPVLVTADPTCFDLHFSQFSLESLDREEKLMELGSRNFFVCLKKPNTVLAGEGRSSDTVAASSSAATCSQEAEIAAGSCFEWLRLMDFLL
ncbi:hypothetical protein CDL15_Pgr026797 [Punica granatum]|nr:hypothetical protein CDL15_Pgr026797 [Punica granatum]